MELNRANAGRRPFAPPEGNTYFLDSVLQADGDVNNDNHSSEEELEVINSRPKEPLICRNGSRCGNLSVNLRSASVNALPEKRRWSEISLSGVGSVGKINRLSVTPGAKIDQSSGSSDDEVQGLFAAMSTPVEFRSSPPRNLVKPGKSHSPPPKLFHQEVSSRRRHRHTHRPHHLLQRPCLDFEKMQQVSPTVLNPLPETGTVTFFGSSRFPEINSPSPSVICK
ncbi:UNVERIFIED_CONTAM: hypothetical protein PYX00_009503 [Menopon gallinae]|uniref:Uncharacterized protein n=1 Tax=Menopon gallinae TaxID=328185 RepID=A0AAW2HBI6_9NEOP